MTTTRLPVSPSSPVCSYTHASSIPSNAASANKYYFCFYFVHEPNVGNQASLPKKPPENGRPRPVLPDTNDGCSCCCYRGFLPHPHSPSPSLAPSTPLIHPPTTLSLYAASPSCLLFLFFFFSSLFLRAVGLTTAFILPNPPRYSQVHPKTTAKLNPI